VLVVGARWELDDSTVPVVTADDVAKNGIAWTVERIREFIGGERWYLSVDLDVIRPDELPAVSSPVPAGPSVEEVTRIVRALLAHRPVAADVVEYNPLLDDAELSALGRLEPMMEAFRQWLRSCDAPTT
jgi:arginase family enzyme